ncbi:hypothetical protein Tfer_0245 [Thermincola ferriacetica]|uniref:Uncharacterized protein n=1 Tax=Thermincola ferriacetica TaxID=281456 RepID=A0A0L6W6F9_9FIRM|nr:hypothetical protein [Thermincola ferriacetica]KNZ71167.1 hypothetical protein Tfer_0245 [Thermincola ferriacetica]
MAKIVLPSDGIVNGSIDNKKGTKATISANVSCQLFSPVGTVSGTVQFPRKFGLLQRFSFSSNTPVFVRTFKFGGIENVEAVFKKVTLINFDTNTATKNCVLTLVASQVVPNTWVGAFTIVCPNGQKIVIFGVFSGDVTVNRKVSCGVLPLFKNP